VPFRSSSSTSEAEIVPGAVTGGERSPAATSRSTLTPAQRRTRERVETVIGLAAPFLDLLLAVGDRISRIAEPEDHEYYPVRADELPSDRRTTRATGD
jgi:hypothetical protein